MRLFGLLVFLVAQAECFDAVARNSQGHSPVFKYPSLRLGARRLRLSEVDMSSAEVRNMRDYSPSVLETLRFVAPVSFIYVTNFLMGAIDSYSVSRFGGTMQLAALAPAVTGIEYVCYAFVWLSQAATKLLSDASGDVNEGRNVLSVAMFIAICAGFTQTLLSLIFAPAFMNLIGVAPEIAPFAIEYMRIRACTAWAFYLTQVGASACFAKGDSLTPFAISVSAGLVNLCGNFALCRREAWTATAGAAIATVISQLLAMACTFVLLAKGKLLPARPALPDLSAALRRFGSTLRKLLPRFLSFAGPASVATTTRIFVYGFCNSMSCRIGTSAAAAAHQVGSNLWWGMSSLTAEPMEAATLSFLPARLQEDNADDGSKRKVLTRRSARQIVRTQVNIEIVIGVMLSLLMGFTFGTESLGWFVDDPAVLALVPMKVVAVACTIVGPMLVLEGTLICLGMYGWLVTNIVVSAIISCVGMCVAERMMPTWRSPSLYWAFVDLFVILRLIGNGFGVLKASREKPNLAETRESKSYSPR